MDVTRLFRTMFVLSVLLSAHASARRLVILEWASPPSGYWSSTARAMSGACGTCRASSDTGSSCRRSTRSSYYANELVAPFRVGVPKPDRKGYVPDHRQQGTASESYSGGCLRGGNRPLCP